MSGPTLIASLLGKASKSIIGRDKSRARLSMARLIDQWPEIIAPEDPLVARPVRVGWRKLPEMDGKKCSEGTLYIAAPSALAARLTYQQAVIVARVNRLFGMPDHCRIARISLAHDRIAAPFKRAPRTGGVVDAATSATLDGVADPVLRARLEKLARAMAGAAAGEKPR
ncbi:MAG: DUF721 domain-containing protein [Alphaproteobacteria bacterium]|nr:DUF721 domain-containing protein [Alphaproteobacteria bacterium]USO07647.1 MAG: DUF721 domain-containing protein [Rhodospirillales bacterium]